MHPRTGSATLSQLAFPGESNLNFPWEKSHWDNTVVKSKVKSESKKSKRKSHNSKSESLFSGTRHFVFEEDTKMQLNELLYGRNENGKIAGLGRRAQSCILTHSRRRGGSF